LALTTATAPDLQATERFGDRVADYVRYRPDYPPALLDWLRAELGMTSSWRVADIGAGTGISSQMFLDAGHAVIAVEPNAAMRGAAVARLRDNPRFRAVDGRSDATGLADASIDLVTVAQAFHWFDPQAARKEFHRIMRPRGLAAIWWNSRRLTGTPFLEGYEALLQRYGTDYAKVAERCADDAGMRAWFGDGLRGAARFDHRQRLDFDGLRGRLLSSSYTPKVGDPNHEPMLRALRELFDATAVDGTVSMDYDTRIFAGELA
jgi:SAM-dependent methyltransferase